ncbi:MAG: hypothetical protein KOO66_09085 [Bacteroidales bacterium]|nr:hypothetical protein [Bacteroidales bacterium]
MDLKKIKALLEKYYSGDTTLDEEKILREYFSSDIIDKELIADKDIFLYQIHENDKADSVPDISNKIWSTLNGIEIDNTKKFYDLRYLFLRIAAGVVILTGSFFLLKNQVFKKDQNFQFTDTYENPELAYQQAKETLLYVSAMLNNGVDHMEPIQKISEGTQKLNALSSFNKGLKELSPISKYSLADKYIKQ